MTDNQIWPLSPEEAKDEQLRLRDHVIPKDHLGLVRCVAGLDVHYDLERHLAYAAIAVFGLPSLSLQESVLACRPITFPYVPGLLSYREAPAMLDALSYLSHKPDVLLIDGQGIAHPRHFGLACHVGVVVNIPAIGVAKSHLVGDYEEAAEDRGTWSPLILDGQVVGAVLRTRASVKPLFVSPGHRISLETGISYVLECTTHFRLAEVCFIEVAPGSDLRITTMTETPDFSRDDIDVAVQWGYDNWGDLDATLLLKDYKIICCTPGIASEMSSPRDLANKTLLQPILQNSLWADIFDHLGIEQHAETEEIALLDAATMRRATISGLGLGQVSTKDALEDIRAGDLVAPVGIEALADLPEEKVPGFYLVMPRSHRRTSRIKMFYDWILSQDWKEQKTQGTPAS